MKFIKEFDLKWYIFSDGEESTIKTVRNAVKVITEDAYDTLSNVIIIENGYDYEKMLIKNKNDREIISAINMINKNEKYYENYTKKLQEEVKIRRRKTDKPPCDKCGQEIYEDILEEEITDLDENERKLYRCMISSNGKAKYAVTIAQYIIKSEDIRKRFPKKILKLLVQIEKDFGIKRREEYNGIEVIGEATRNS